MANGSTISFTVGALELRFVTYIQKIEESITSLNGWIRRCKVHVLWFMVFRIDLNIYRLKVLGWKAS